MQNATPDRERERGANKYRKRRWIEHTVRRKRRGREREREREREYKGKSVRKC